MIGAIPAKKAPKEYAVADFTESDFVEIISDKMFDVQMQYPLLGMENAVECCLVREEVYDRLIRAHALMPDGFKFRIFDAWRPLALQHELYEWYSKQIIQKYDLSGYSKEERDRFVQKFVSNPAADRTMPPVHTTGGAVDLTILDDSGKTLAMGTVFDEFSEKAYTAYFEKGHEDNIRDNRRLLYHVMTAAGFTNLPSEWWHFDYGDRFWGYYCGKPACYRGVFTKEEMYEGKWKEEFGQ